jgi:hypothetical protein
MRRMPPLLRTIVECIGGLALLLAMMGVSMLFVLPEAAASAFLAMLIYLLPKVGARHDVNDKAHTAWLLEQGRKQPKSWTRSTVRFDSRYKGRLPKDRDQ